MIEQEAQPSQKYLGSFPKPLLDDLVAGRWLPVIGAGVDSWDALRIFTPGTRA